MALFAPAVSTFATAAATVTSAATVTANSVASIAEPSFDPVYPQPVCTQPVKVEPVVLKVAAAEQESLSLAELVAPAVAVQLTSNSSEALTNFVIGSESALSGVQATVDVANEDADQLAPSTAATSPLVSPVNSSLELKGSHELLDDVFSGDIDVVEYKVVHDAEETEIVDFDDCVSKC